MPAVSNTASVAGQDRQAIGNQPDETPATGGQTVGGGGGGGFINPMTTPGDMIAGGTVGIPIRIPGNATTRRKYLSQRGTGTASLTPAWTNGPMVNLIDENIIPAGAAGADLTAQINALLPTLPDHSAIYLPSTGNAWRIDGPVNVTNRILTWVGDGSNATVVITTSTTAAMFAISGGQYAMRGIQFTDNGGRVIGNPLTTIAGASSLSEACNVFDLYVLTSGDGFQLTGGAGWQAANVIMQSNVSSLPNGAGQKLLQLQGCTVGMTNCRIRNSTNGAPAMWVQGSTTSMQFSNCDFSGGGSLYAYTPTAISVSGSNLTVSLANTTGFYVDDYIVMTGMTSASYNGFWKITAVSANTSVTAVATPFYALPTGTGVVGSGKAETVPCCVLIDNTAGFNNESVFTNCMLEAQSAPTDPLSAAAYLQGTAGNTSMEGWAFSNCYFDYGWVGAMLTGTFSSGLGSAGLERISFSNIITLGELASIFISQVPGVQISNLQPGNVNKFSTPPSCGVYVYSGGVGTAVKSEGLMISNSLLGGTPVWNNILYSTQVCTYGIIIDGAIGTINVSGCILWGLTAPVLNNSGVTLTTDLGGGANQLLQGTSNPPTPVFVPYFSVLNGAVTGYIELTSNQMFTTGSGGEAPISWSAAGEDPAGVWSAGSPTILSVPAGTRHMQLGVTARWVANATNSRSLRIKDTTVSANTRAEDSKAACGITGIPTGHTPATAPLNVAALGIAGFVVNGIQDSGGNLDLIGSANFPTAVWYRLTP